MNPLLNSDQDEDIADLHRRSPYARDREITLGTTMVLGIFFALAVFAAVCFGIGYSMGAKHANSSVAAASTGTGTSGAFNNFKPAPGSFAGATSPSAQTPPEDSAVSLAPPVAPPRAVAPKVVPEPPADDAVQPASPPQTAPTAAVRPIPARTVTTPLPAAPVTALAPVAGQSMVQVAAVSHQEDADLLLSTLKRRGYSVAVHTEPQDKLLHVQIGPFSNRKEADAMRQRLLADGFNAIVKQ